jgi:hypothetical protein
VIGWLCGGIVFGLAFLAPLPPIDRGVLAQLAGPTVTMIIALAAVRAVFGGPQRNFAGAPAPRGAR